MITSRPACVVIIDFPRSSTSLLLLHVGMLQPPCRHVVVFMSACCSLHVYMLRPSCLHVAVFMSTCCSLHVCMLRTSCLHVAAFMSACCSVHVYMLQCSCLHVAAFMSTCCSVHVCMLRRSCLHVAACMSTCCIALSHLVQTQLNSVQLHCRISPLVWTRDLAHNKDHHQTSADLIDPLTFEPRYKGQ